MAGWKQIASLTALNISLRCLRKLGAGEGIRTLDPNLGNAPMVRTHHSVWLHRLREASPESLGDRSLTRSIRLDDAVQFTLFVSNFSGQISAVSEHEWPTSWRLDRVPAVNRRPNSALSPLHGLSARQNADRA